MQIDWEEQWRIHAPDFKDDRVQRPLPGSERLLELLPGPGFGDCSHPTTRLMLRLMEGDVQNRSVLDMGCGSGVLAISASLMGARHLWGLDIDAEAVEHARRNAELNGAKIQFEHVDNWKPAAPRLDVLLLNMTYGEQHLAWQQLEKWGLEFDLALVSGLLVEQCPEAIQTWMQRGFEVDKIKKEGEWCAMKLRTRNRTKSQKEASLLPS